MTRWMLPIGLLLSALPAQDNLHYDFETVTALTDLPALQANRGNTLSLVSPGHGDSRQALLVESPEPSKYAQVAFKQPLTLVRNLVLSFDVRAESPDATNYVGILFSDQNNKTYFASVPFEPGWRHHELVVASFHPVDGGRFALGMEFKQFTIYGRAKADSGARMKVWLDNVTVAPHVTEGKMADLRVSTANPPLFNWPAQQGAVTVAWSQDPAFAAAATTTAEVRDNWYTPPQPLAPGRWYWRHSRNDEFRDGWSDTMPVEITPEAHRFSPGAIPLDELSRRPHPRLLNAAAERASLNAEQRAALCREAERIFQENIADDCPIWVEGDPRWPTWIDWYGKAHGGITSRAGTRLQRLATILMRTGDPQVREWTRALALKASKWDPEGGSNPGRGDIGAHHFERGLNWCYDALAEDPTTPELPAIRAALEVRAGQFWKRLNPFRGNEFNNHSWLNAFGLAESGLVLAGESPEAGAWARFVLELFVGRFLCALGYQGDNNEGISYWAYGLSFVVDYAAMMKRVVGVDLYRHPWLAQTARFPLYTTPPQAYAVSFADTGQPNHGTKGPAATREVLGLARETGDPYALWYAGAREPVAGVAPKPPVDIPQSIWYRFIGWAIHNTSLLDGRDGVTVAMRSGPFYAGHQHEDLNSFVIHAYGEKLAIDGGHYDWYGSAQFKNWSTLTRAHNSILVNGRDQGSREKGADGQITAWFDSPEFGYSVGRVADPDVYAGQVERWDRALLFLKPGLLVIRDTLAATAGPARWDWLLQSVGEIRTDPAQRTFSLTSGEAALNGQFVAPSDLDLAVTSGFPDNAQPVDRYSTRPSPPERTPLEYHLTVTPRAPRQNEEFLAVMAIDRAAEATALQSRRLPATGGQGLTVTADGAQTTVLFRDPASAEVRGGGLATDAEVLAFSMAAEGYRALLLGGTRIVTTHSRPAQTVVAASAPVSLAARGLGAGVVLNCSAPAPVTLTLFYQGQPAVLLDGKTHPARYNATTNLLSIEVPAGEHELAVGDGAASLVGHALPPLEVAVDGQSQRLEGYARRTADGLEPVHWGLVELPRADRYRLEVGGQPRRVVVDQTTLAPGAEQWLEAGRHWLMITGPVAALQLTGLGSAAKPAAQLPAGFKPAADSLVIDADPVTAESEVKGKVIDKVGALGGKAHCNWDTPGQWAEWEFAVPRAGRYQLLIRACGDDGEVVRALLLDGQPLALLRLAPTGGWSRESDDWRYFEVPEAVNLTAGRHRLRLEQVGGSLNLDSLVWQPRP